VLGHELLRQAETCEKIREAGGWVSESRLHRDADYGRGCRVVEYLALPGLVRGYLECESTTEGRAVYRVSEAGQAWLAGPAPKPVTEREVDQAAANLYGATLDVAIEELRVARPQNARELGLFPRGPWVGCPVAEGETV
jgi:hypothetical protein